MLSLIKGIFILCVCLKIILILIYFVIRKNSDIRLKHNYNNILQAIGGYITLDDFEGLKIYYKDLLLDYKWGRRIK